MTDTSRTPEAVVQAQLDAYNAHDVEALVATYAEDAQQFQHPSTLLASGRAQMRARFSGRFAESRPQAKLLKRMVAGNLVIDHESIASQTPAGPASAELVAIYEVSGGLIAKAWFMTPAAAPTPSSSNTGAPLLRLALAADVAAMEALIARSGIELSAGFYTPEQATAVTNHVFGVDSQLVEDRTYFLIEQDGAVVACGGWSKRNTLFGGDQTKTGPDPLLDPEREPARIRAFFVDPKMARRGLGRQLMQHCSEQAQLAGFRALELAATMPGVPLYLASGFAEVAPIELTLPGEGGAAGAVKVGLVKMRKAIA